MSLVTDLVVIGIMYKILLFSKDKGGDTALVWAVDKSHIDVVQMLIEKGPLDGSNMNVK